MNILFFPAGDRNFASSRLRVWKIADALGKLGHKVAVELPRYLEHYTFSYDVLVVQKRTDCTALMESAVLHGLRVVYDVDDYIPNLPAQMADVVTVDTPAKLELYPNAVVIPDCLDVEDGHPQKSVHADNLTNVVWTGNPENLHHLSNLAQACADLHIMWTAITNENSQTFQDALFEFPEPLRHWMQCEPWSLETVDRTMIGEWIEHDLFVAPFVFNGRWSDEWVRSKSANRIVKAWSLGLPVAGTAIPAYTEAGLRYQAQTVEEWRDVLTQLQDPVLRAQDARRGQEYAQQFTADKVAQQWLKVFQA